MDKRKPDTTDESGSTGRRTGVGAATSSGDTGQDHYGQTGYGQGGYDKGPEGEPPADYHSSDDGLKELLMERLHEDPDIDDSDVTVIVQGGVITLEGTVDNPRTRSTIENVADQIGIRSVQNNLRVLEPGGA